MKRWSTLVAIITTLLFLLIGVPIIINELYKYPGGYYTLWNPSDVLQFYGSVLGAVGTAVAIYISLFLAKRTAQAEIEKERLNNQYMILSATVLKIKNALLLKDCEAPSTTIFELKSEAKKAEIAILNVTRMIVEDWPKVQASIDKDDSVQNDYFEMTTDFIAEFIATLESYGTLLERAATEHAEYLKRKKEWEHDNIEKRFQNYMKAGKKENFTEKEPLSTTDVLAKLYQDLQEICNKRKISYQKSVDGFLKAKEVTMHKELKQLYSYSIISRQLKKK